jgi:cytochrome b6-f complex iron-sulfur subunit
MAARIYDDGDPPTRDFMRDQTRRNFLRTFTAGAATCAFGASCGGAGSVGPAEFGDVSAGNVKDLPVGALKKIDSAPAVIGRDSAGLYALTATCTHMGCLVEVQGSSQSPTLFCQCHGSGFDRNGGVSNGPANAPLVHFAVTLDASGNVTVHGGTQVDAGIRVPVP